jgi:glutamyl-tRNA synthetase
VLHDEAGKRLSKRAASEGLEALRSRGLDGPSVIGLLASSAGLMSEGTRLSAAELLAEVRRQPAVLDNALRAATRPERL